MLIVLVLGMLVAVGAAQPHNGGKSHYGGHQYDWLSTGVTHYSYPTYYTYPSNYYDPFSYYNYQGKTYHPYSYSYYYYPSMQYPSYAYPYMYPYYPYMYPYYGYQYGYPY